MASDQEICVRLRCLGSAPRERIAEAALIGADVVMAARGPREVAVATATPPVEAQVSVTPATSAPVATIPTLPTYYSRYGYSVALRDPAWRKWTSRETDLPDADYGALMGGRSGFAVVPVLLMGQDLSARLSS